jgi:uncharacterized protein
MLKEFRELNRQLSQPVMARVTPENRRTLLTVAARTIALAAMLPERPWRELDVEEYADELRQLRASFVTVHRRLKLRGCRGSIAASEPLVVNVARSARAAAFFDERFSPIVLEEVAELDLHISVLGTPRRLIVDSEGKLLSSLRVGIDGLIIREGSRQALFLPSVWEKLEDPQTFVEHLKVKAGLPPSYWSSGIVCERFTVEEFGGLAADFLDDV